MGNNKGFSLVELLVAFAVSAIVLTCISSLLFSGLKLYGRSNANIEVQNESQAVLNLLVDNVMQAGGICMRVPATGNTECLLMGTLNIIEDSRGFIVRFKGTAMVSDIPGAGELYLVEFPNDKFPEIPGTGFCELTDAPVPVGDGEGKAAEAGLDAVREYIIDMNKADRIQWLMGSYVTDCTMVPPRTADDFTKEVISYVDSPDEDRYYFAEPFTLRISLSFAYDYGDNIVTRTLQEEVSVRSRLKEIYADVGDVDDDGTTDGMVRFMRKQEK